MASYLIAFSKDATEEEISAYASKLESNGITVKKQFTGKAFKGLAVGLSEGMVAKAQDEGRSGGVTGEDAIHLFLGKGSHDKISFIEPDQEVTIN